MCRIMAIAGVKKDKQDLMWKFLIQAKDYMTQHNKDGVGYAAHGEKGLWGERWLDPDDAWLKESRKPFTKVDKITMDAFKGGLEANIKYNSFGKVDADQHTPAIIYHSRAATCEKNMANTHPFVRENTALIHNGVIRNTETLKMISSTCDSETILNEYVDENVADDADNITNIGKALFGYYGCAVLTTDSKGKRWLDIFKHDAPIHVAFINELKAMVFCTSDDIIRFTCKDLKLTYGHMFTVKNNSLIRIDAETGVPAFVRTFEPASTFYEANQFNRSSSGSATAGELETTQKDGLTHSATAESEKKSTALTIVPPTSTSTTGLLTQEEVEAMRSQKEPLTG